jgi:hypothetical protein
MPNFSERLGQPKQNETYSRDFFFLPTSFNRWWIFDFETDYRVPVFCRLHPTKDYPISTFIKLLGVVFCSIFNSITDYQTIIVI